MPTEPRPTSRADILEGALRLLRSGRTVSLESAARAAGLTKPGLMYHFATKEALMTALVDHVVDGYERDLVCRLSRTGTTTAEARLSAYVDWCFTADIDQTDLVIFTDPRLRERLTTRWTDRMQEWLRVPEDLPPKRRAQLLAARLLADGSWFADASGILPLSAEERREVRDVARDLLRGTP